MGTQINACVADESDFPKLIHLGSTYYTKDHPALSEAFLNWLYLDNPDGPATLIVARDGELWIGLIALIPVTLEYAGAAQKACYAVNVLTHPEHRGKKLFAKMIFHARNFLSEENVWLLGHPNANATRGWNQQEMQFREPLQVYLAKPRFPFSFVSERRITDIAQLRSIPSELWRLSATREDVHVKYTPEFIAWRYLSAPHRKYVVSAIEKNGEFFGLRVTRRFKWNVDLMVDFVGASGKINRLISSVNKPTLVMHPGYGCSGYEVRRACWKPPVKRRLPFFVTTWNQGNGHDMSGITLAASDF